MRWCGFGVGAGWPHIEQAPVQEGLEFAEHRVEGQAGAGAFGSILSRVQKAWAREARVTCHVQGGNRLLFIGRRVPNDASICPRPPPSDLDSECEQT
ncbi:hypothetical protein GCM10018966_078140 [Streptomyces yanii]